ncbi:MAG: hypothetical protein A3C71_00345 [Candidatus Yanofskybacteria bacterium RIFCSPHIGHO2_02_FULL_43_15c]|uniref:R3H domain-containing protein n=1 Tax=Candidatus Yanofskybacteria bacterium RIFCSPHIGHO2_02_FULL_43_15c TaxID=1802679 RepID=A0A1F8FJ78_9BACT|nr:MAG: hypothetical protein A3C71_00345 [Candidatus Yanofskybacteria bacterium RIFCSPHIGHO2_02_FULL_43_15c]
MTQENDNQDLLKTVTQQILGYLGYQAEVNIFPSDKDSNLKIVSINSPENISALIGKNGQNIKALEQVVKTLYYKKVVPLIDSEQTTLAFMVDLNDYRQLRAKQVVTRAVEAANRVRISKKAEALLPMSSYERRLIHVELASYPDIETESIGEEPKRRVVIRPLII